ncbi:conserved hypothetical protein [Lebetimonas natsushimae]|uniref:Uncharacterized protein n=1 Tax=Lebetimonas natsushimae TaxID=1936991 RepID=A0A292YE74_9BACT|nr:hypothetical protein [Lebetimonas natsushimae]GAX87609.1 conserved hypothetical protein [Lebetimonas natsushimae]
MVKIRENIINILKKGDIPSYDYINYFDKVRNIKFQKDSFLQKNINALKNYYNDATEEEKAIINNVIFILEIFNSKKDALKDFLFRTLLFNHKKLNTKDIYYALDFFKNSPSALSPDLLIEVLKEILEPQYFFSLEANRRRSVFINILYIWHNPNIFVKLFWLEQLPIFKKLLDFAMKQNYIEDIMYIEFYIYHFYGNSSQTIKEWEKFNEMIEKPLSQYFKNWGSEHKLPKPYNYNNNKKRIAFLIDRLVTTSPLIVEYSLWKTLMKNNEFRENYEIFVYSMNYVEKQPDDKLWIEELKKLGITVYTPQYKFYQDGYFYNHLEKALDLREQILKDKIDILISFFGYAIPNFLFSTRTAPKQIFWSHGNCTSEIENIDLRISHFPQECKNYDWKIFDIQIDEEFLIGSQQNQIEAKKIKEKLLKKFGKDTVILGTIGRFVKIDSNEYIKLIAEIMKQNPNTIYLACGHGNENSIKEKLKKYNIDKKRFIFNGMVNPHVYGWVIDIWPDSFPLGQGKSKDEFIAKKRPVIFHIKRKIKSNKKNKVFIANDDKEYIEMVTALIKNAKKREEIGNLEYKQWYENKKNIFLKIINK